jgi:hypothetical protein
MIELSKLYLFIGAALVLLLIPGPAVLYITARSASQGRMAGQTSPKPLPQPWDFPPSCYRLRWHLML